MKENTDNGHVKFRFAGANRNLKIKFHDKRNVKIDPFQSFVASLHKKLWNPENYKYHDETEEKFDHELENETALLKPKLKLLIKDEC